MRSLYAFALAVLLAASPAPGEDAQPAPIDRYKAVFLYHFTGYVTWPATTDSLFRVGILGDSAVTPLLRTIARTKKVDGRTITVTTYDKPAALARCDLLFVTEAFARDFDKIAARSQAFHALTVTDATTPSPFAIRFVRVGDQLKFAIDQKALERAGLKATVQLLKLALKD